MAILLLCEELVDALGNHRTDVIDLRQFISRGLGQRIDSAITRRQNGRNTLANVADAEAEQQACEAALTAAVDSGDEITGRFIR